PDMVNICNKFYLVKTGDSYDGVASKNGVTSQQILKWNPSVDSTCAGLWAHAYICVGIIDDSTTKPGRRRRPRARCHNSNTHAVRMVINCNKFCLVQSGDICNKIASKSGITATQFRSWNPSVAANCSGLWAEHTFASVPKPTNTTKGNGVTRPTLTQTGMVKNCKKFHLVVAGHTCAATAKKYTIATANFVKWNPAVKSDCTGLWAKTYACVGLIWPLSSFFFYLNGGMHCELRASG
ncbi:carbohydrate-binding module family 50 protein, partial [Dactylonectria estremocensis]